MAVNRSGALGGVGSPEFLQRAYSGQIEGVRRVVFSGFNNDIDIATTPEDIWSGGGLIPIPSSAESWEIVSASANDTSAGTGARTVQIRSLDANFNEVVQTVTLNGLTPVALTGTHLRINSALVLTAGSSRVNEGLLTIRLAGAGADRGFITSPEGVLNQCKFTVPDGFHLDVMSAVMSIRTFLGNENAVINAVNTNAAGRSLATVRFGLFSAGQSIYRHEVSGGALPFVTLTSRSEMTWRVASVSQNNTGIDVAALGLLYDDALFPIT